MAERVVRKRKSAAQLAEASLLHGSYEGGTSGRGCDVLSSSPPKSTRVSRRPRVPPDTFLHRNIIEIGKARGDATAEAFTGEHLRLRDASRLMTSTLISIMSFYCPTRMG